MELATVRALNELQLRFTVFAEKQVTLAELLEVSTRLDAAITEVSTITAPVNIENITAFSNSKLSVRWPYQYCKWSLPVLGFLVTLIAVWSYSDAASVPRNLSMSILATCLGILGALVLVLYNAIGVLTEKSVDIADRYGTTVRLLLGGLSGWVLFFVFAQSAFSGTAQPDTTMLFLPFLAGFSTKLVLGVINQALRAVQLTLGIEDSNTQLLARQRSKRPLVGTPGLSSTAGIAGETANKATTPAASDV